MDWLADWFSSLVSSAFAWLLSLLPSWVGQGWADVSLWVSQYPLLQHMLWVFAIDVWVPVVAAAALVRFTIRRIPLIG